MNRWVVPRQTKRVLPGRPGARRIGALQPPTGSFVCLCIILFALCPRRQIGGRPPWPTGAASTVTARESEQLYRCDGGSAGRERGGGRCPAMAAAGRASNQKDLGIERDGLCQGAHQGVERPPISALHLTMPHPDGAHMVLSVRCV